MSNSKTRSAGVILTSDDDGELTEILSRLRAVDDEDDDTTWPDFSMPEESQAASGPNEYVQWTSPASNIFVPSGAVNELLPPGAYVIRENPRLGTYFETVPVKTEGLIAFPQTNVEKVSLEIGNFWDRETLFRQFDLAYKRGILLWGPAGCGKSSCIQLIMRDVIARGGIVINFDHPVSFLRGWHLLREIQPTTPVVVIMEDIESILEQFSETMILNILDGIEHIDKAVFVATTNFPEKLGARIVNRPSRFDKRFKIALPNSESRRLYLDSIRGQQEIALERWVRDTDGFSLAHLKELFVAVIILGDEYKDSLKTLTSMRENVISSLQDGTGSESEGDNPRPGQYI